MSMKAVEGARKT